MKINVIPGMSDAETLGYAKPASDNPEKPTTWAADRIAELESQVHELKIAMMVQDVTIYILDIIARPDVKDLFAGQVAVAREAYKHATGEESMIGFRRNAPAGKARVKLSGADRDQEWPWCEACQSYHHPSNITCKAKQNA